MKLYLDACCLNRLTDDQSQARVREEAEAVEGILRLIRDGQATWSSSSVLEIEISRNPDSERRHDVASLLALATDVVIPGGITPARAAFLQTLGFEPFDALHRASAEQGDADVFLTTDDNLLRRAARYRTQFRIRILNPISWYKETLP